MDIEALRDYLIADEIERISSLPPADLIQELVAIKTARLEHMSNDELLATKYGHT